MVVPFAHVAELNTLPQAGAHELMDLSQKMETVLRQVYSPDGINLGMNIGRGAPPVGGVESFSQNTPSLCSSSRVSGSAAHGSHHPMFQTYSVNTVLIAFSFT